MRKLPASLQCQSLRRPEPAATKGGVMASPASALAPASPCGPSRQAEPDPASRSSAASQLSSILTQMASNGLGHSSAASSPPAWRHQQPHKGVVFHAGPAPATLAHMRSLTPGLPCVLCWKG
ncbi:hypothetical protein WJX72_009028 [[Myrmecia] bisecta]|uniref:Uncharacterized protein n=1 Tax=[Myrmecia] bisecta TaxID=41462 RepID=A0AAW1Q9U5_9CHLO